MTQVRLSNGQTWSLGWTHSLVGWYVFQRRTERKNPETARRTALWCNNTLSFTMLANAGATHSQPTQDTPRLTLSSQIFHPWVTLYYCFCCHLTAMNHSRAEPQSWVTAERLPRFSFCFPDTTVSPWPSHRLTVQETLAESFPISCLSQQRTAQLTSFIHFIQSMTA